MTTGSSSCHTYSPSARQANVASGPKMSGRIHRPTGSIVAVY